MLQQRQRQRHAIRLRRVRVLLQESERRRAGHELCHSRCPSVTLLLSPPPPPLIPLPFLSLSLPSGTPAFLAPECCQVGEFHTKRADVWAAGVSMYCMLFGAVPFTCQSETSSIAVLMRSIVEQPLTFPQSHAVSPHALQLLSQLLEKDPELRISLDAALLNPWVTAAEAERPSGLKRLPSGLPDNDILRDASAEDVRRAVINVSNWALLVKVKTLASRHVQGFRERRKIQDDS